MSCWPILGACSIVNCVNTFAPLQRVIACLSVVLCGVVHAQQLPPLEGAVLLALGKQLFHDSALSDDRATSCATCHVAPHYHDGRAQARGVWGRQGVRKTPSLNAIKYYRSFAWDGTRGRLEEQVLLPFVSDQEHGLSSLNLVLARVNLAPEYAQFQHHALFDEATIAKALASYVRSLAPPTKSNIGNINGQQLFSGKARCATCHDPSQGYTDNKIHAALIPLKSLTLKQQGILTELRYQQLNADYERNTKDPERSALGHVVKSRDPLHLGFFRTPSLLHLNHAAYGHQGLDLPLKTVIALELKRSQVHLNESEFVALYQFVVALSR